MGNLCSFIKSNRFMKRWIGLFFAATFLLLLSACVEDSAGGPAAIGPAASQSPASNAPETEKQEPSSAPAEDGTKILVVCFSATGTTKDVAGRIVEFTGADYFEISPAEPYSEADLNYHNDDCRANREQQDENARPSISGAIENMDQYEVVLIGHPIWWGREPRIMDTFMESYDFSGKTLVNFCTSGGSGIATSTENLKALSPDADWLEGRRFSADTDAEAIQEWIDSLDLE